MRFISLLGALLKSDEVVELLEANETRVIYDFDRLNEGTPDRYWAEFKHLGYLLRFDANQTLDAVFIYVIPSEGYSGVDPNILQDVPFFKSRDEVDPGSFPFACALRRGDAALGGRKVCWARVDASEFSLHFEFRDGVLSLITLSRKP